MIQNIKAKMEEIKESSFAPGMDYNISYDVSRFLDASISVVLRTLFGSLFAGVYRGIFVPAGFPFDVDSGDSLFLFRFVGYFLLYADVGFLHQYADTVRASNRLKWELLLWQQGTCVHTLSDSAALWEAFAFSVIFWMFRLNFR